jgi:hypothetical protein
VQRERLQAVARGVRAVGGAVRAVAFAGLRSLNQLRPFFPERFELLVRVLCQHQASELNRLVVPLRLALFANHPEVRRPRIDLHQTIGARLRRVAKDTLKVSMRISERWLFTNLFHVESSLLSEHRRRLTLPDRASLPGFILSVLRNVVVTDKQQQDGAPHDQRPVVFVMMASGTKLIRAYKSRS